QIQLSAASQNVDPTGPQLKALHSCIKKVTEDLDALHFNTAISALMIFINEAITWQQKPRTVLRDFLILLQPFAPHLAEELWSRLSKRDASTESETSDFGLRTLDLPYQPWPKADPALLVEETLEI